MKLSHQHILVIQTAFIGDAILASSVIEKLHQFYPSASISILVRKGNESLYQNHPFLKEVIIWDKQAGKYSSLWQTLKKIRSEKYDTIINLHRYASSGFLTAFSGAPYTSGFNKNPFSFHFNFKAPHKIGDGRHEIERYNDLIADITDTTIIKPKLYPSESQINKIKEYVKPSYITIAPSSVWQTKQLPEHKWIELCNSMPSNTCIYILGAANDSNLAERIQKSSHHQSIVSLVGKLSLLESAALMQKAIMNYVNDSAPLHLASSLNAPVTAFFCSTIPEFGFFPLSDNSQVIEVKNLECRPCGLHGHKACPKQHFKCGNEIILPELKIN